MYPARKMSPASGRMRTARINDHTAVIQREETIILELEKGTGEVADQKRKNQGGEFTNCKLYVFLLIPATSLTTFLVLWL
jgi:hypothetical protein